METAESAVEERTTMHLELDLGVLSLREQRYEATIKSNKQAYNPAIVDIPLTIEGTKGPLPTLHHHFRALAPSQICRHLQLPSLTGADRWVFLPHCSKYDLTDVGICYRRPDSDI
jgi:hypothetical protein